MGQTTASIEDMDKISELGSSGKTPNEIKTGIEKASDIQSSASEIDNNVKNSEVKKQSSYIKSIRNFKTLDGVSIYTDNGVTTSITPENTLKIKLNNSTSINRVLIDLSGYGEGFLTTEKRTLGLKLKFTNSAKLSYMNTMLMSNSTNINTLQNTSIQAINIYQDGSYDIPLYDKDFTVTTGDPINNEINFLRLDVVSDASNGSGDDLEIELTEVVKFREKKSRCMISYDDGHNTNMEIAQLLEARGIRGTFYIYTDGIGESGNLTLAEAQSLYNNGHDIGVHSVTHESAVTVGDSQYFDYQKEARIWIRKNIGIRASDHCAFVGGHSTENLRQNMHNAGFKSTRNAVPKDEFIHSGFGTSFENKYNNPRYQGNTYEMFDQTTVAEMIVAHQEAIDNNQDFFVYGHQLLTNATAQAWSDQIGDPYSMPDYFDWVKSKVDSGEITVHTVSDFWNEFENTSW